MRKPLPAADRLRAVRKALREHALLGRSVSVWRDGRIVRLSPAEILAELDGEPPPAAATEGKSQND
jgi:hypothetical protein